MVMSEAKAGERFEMLGGNIQGEFVEVRTDECINFSTEELTVTVSPEPYFYTLYALHNSPSVSAIKGKTIFSFSQKLW